MYTKRIWIIFIPFLFFTIAALCQGDTPLTSTSYAQQEVKNEHFLSEEEWNKAKDGILYEQEKEEEQTENPKPIKPPFFNLSLLKYVFYGAIIAGIIYLLVWLALRLNKKAISPPPPGWNIQENEPVNQDELMLLDFDKLIPDAIQRGDLRMATRFLYLKTLQTLVAAGIIVWRRDQTNRTIVTQVPDTQLRLSTKQVFVHFETIWYGEKPLEEKEFSTYYSQCQDLVSKLQQLKK